MKKSNKTGKPNANESLKDPLTNKYIYSSNYCAENSVNSKYVLLTKNFDIVDVDISCNETLSLGQISFGSDGKVYSKLSDEEGKEKEFEIKDECIVKMMNKNGKSTELKITGNTGYVERLRRNK